jgi:hypothetical protein
MSRLNVGGKDYDDTVLSRENSFKTLSSIFSLLFDGLHVVKRLLWKSKNETRCLLWTAAYIPLTLALTLYLARTKIHRTCDVPTHPWHVLGPTLTLSSNWVDQCPPDNASNGQATNQTWSCCVGLCITHGQGEMKTRIKELDQ